MNELDAYDFDLPRELIAQQPLPHRVDARMLVVDRKHNDIHHAHVRDLLEYLAPGDALILFTDGVSEAANTEDDLFTTGRIEAALSSAKRDPSARGLAEGDQADPGRPGPPGGRGGQAQC